MNRLLGRTTILVFFLASSGVLALGQQTADAVHHSLDELTSRAQTIVHAHVIEASEEPHPQLTNLPTLVVKLKVDEVLKGQADAIFIFRQFIWDPRQKNTKAGYGKGEELLLLLNPVSQYGLTSPAGMEQGRFRVTHGADGKAVAENALHNARLFEGVEARAQLAGTQLSPKAKALVQQRSGDPVQLDDLKEAIRSLVRQR